MNLITTEQSIRELCPPELISYITQRYQSLEQDTDIPPTIILVKPEDDTKSPDFQFIGPNGLLSDIFDEHQPGEIGFQHSFEWVHLDENLKIYEALHLAYGEFGTYLIIPEAVTLAHPDLLLALTSQPLLDTLPF